MEGASRCVADLAVGLDDGVPRGQLLFHIGIDMRKDLGEQGLTLRAEHHSIAVLGEPIDEVLGQVRPPDDAQLAEEGVPSGVQTDHHFRPCPTGGFPGGVGFRSFFVDRAGFAKQLLLLSFGKVLQHAHLADEPFFRRVVECCAGLVTLAGQSYQAVQFFFECRNGGGPGEGGARTWLNLGTHVFRFRFVWRWSPERRCRPGAGNLAGISRKADSMLHPRRDQVKDF